MQTEITIDQLVQWHDYFSKHPFQNEKTKEIADSILKRLHTILTQLTPIKPKES